MSSTTQAKLAFLLLLAVSGTALFIGCGAPEGQGPRTTSQKLEGIHFDPSIPKDKQIRITDDLAYLSTLNFGNSSYALKLQKLLKLPDASPDSFMSWVNSSLHVFVSQDYSTKDNLSRFGSFGDPDPTSNGLLPFSSLLGAKATAPTQPDNSKVIMSNLGSAVYISAKQNGRTDALNIPGLGKIVVNTPLVGIIMEGEGLFSNIFGTHSSQYFSYSDPNHIIYRLGTIFHELWHEYGNEAANTLGFEHIACPAGSTYPGKFACDKFLNGPYMIGALFTHAFMDTCAKNPAACPKTATNAGSTHADLLIRYADYMSRVKVKLKNPLAKDVRPELLKRLDDDKDPDLGDSTPERPQ